MKKIVLLGSTGSVGRRVLDVVRSYPDLFSLKAISACESVSQLVEQAREFAPEFVAIENKKFYGNLKTELDGNTKISCGPLALEELVRLEDVDMVFIAIAGTAALKPLISAIHSGKIIALASKEPIVSAGEIISKLVKENSSCILPVDSEHSAIMQCLSGKTRKDVRKIYITGSGGPLMDIEANEFDFLSKEDVLNHPKWDMGPKITVDSATLMNKGLEVIEARWLFDVTPDKIEVVIHPEAIIHSMVEFIDGTISASLFYPDMRFPILKALSFPDILESDFPKVDFSLVKNLSFRNVDTSKFPALEIATNALLEGGTVPSVLNGADEAAVGLFLDGKIKFTDIIRLVERVISKHRKIAGPSLEDIIYSEGWAKEEVKKIVNSFSRSHSL